MNPMTARRGLLLLIVAAALLAACRVDTTVGIELHRDGSGRVRVHVALDEDARRRVPVAAIKLDDLRGAGWRVSRDATSVTVEKSFARAVDLASTLRELSGSSLLLRDVSATRRASFFRTRFAVRVDVDLRELGVGVPSDPDLENRLRLLGLDPSVVELKLDAPLRNAVGLQLFVAMPDGRVRSWSVPAGGRVDARATSTLANGGRTTWLIAAVALAGVALVALTIALIPPFRRRSRRNGAEEVTPPRPVDASAPPAPQPEEASP